MITKRTHRRLKGASKVAHGLRLRLHGSMGSIRSLEGKIAVQQSREDKLTTEITQLKKQLAGILIYVV